MEKATSKNAGVRAATAPEIYLSDQAAAAYTTYCKDAAQAAERGDPAHPSITALREIDECLSSTIPQEYSEKRYALSGDLKAIRRLRIGRVRITWVLHPAGRIEVVFIACSPFKAFSANDPFGALSRRVAAGEFDSLLQNLGIIPPLKMTTSRLQ